MNILDFWYFSSPPRDVQVKALEWLAEQDARYLILEAPVGCHAKGTPILLFDGTIKQVENITPDDVLMGPDSTPRNIISLHKGREMMYTITPKKGDPFIVNESHILSLKTTPARRSGFDGKTTINISVRDYLATSNNFKRNTKLYRSEGITFNHTCILPISPYFLGIYLGDGTTRAGVPSICTSDVEIVEAVQNQATLFGLSVSMQQGHKTAPSYNITTGRKGGWNDKRPNNILSEQLINLDLFGKTSKDKFIPYLYKTASKNDRLQLLAGIIDTDGHFCSKGSFDITTKSPQLANDIVFVARSLGFAANTYIRTIKSGKYAGNKYHSIILSGELSTIPTRLERKKVNQRKQKKRVTVTSFTVTPNVVDDYYGFELDADHLYVMGDFTITHNSGKSLIGATFSRWCAKNKERGDACFLTPQRILQAQYENDFTRKDMFSLYGKSNYQCNRVNSTCAVGSIGKGCKTCAYEIAKAGAIAAPNAVLNYKLALLLFSFVPKFAKRVRPLMVLDECHQLERFLIDFETVSISKKRCEKINVKFPRFKKDTTLPEAIDWLETKFYDPACEYTEELEKRMEAIVERGDYTQGEVRVLREYAGWQELMEAIEILIAQPIEHVDERFVLVHDPMNVQFKKLFARAAFRRILDNKADRFLFMSSTVLNKDAYCKDLGIDPEQAAFLSLDSEFPPENRHVLYQPQMRMNAQWMSDENIGGRRKMVRHIERILGMHDEESGIIHTSNFAIAKWLVEELDGIEHHIFHHNPDCGMDRNDVIDAFQSYDKPSILISPSITEGLDLKEDLGRFAIFAKVPFGYLGDQWIKRRMELSVEWYQRMALTDIIQGGGRVVRSKEDWGYTYILDESWARLFQSTHRMIPKWYRDAYNKIR